MKVSFDKFNRYEIPQISLCNPSSRASIVDGKIVVSNIVGVLDVVPPHLVLNFNAPHEFTFEYVRHLSNDSIKQSFYDNLYNGIETDRYVYIEDIGFFIISNVTNSNEDGIDKKTVICESCEVELKNYEGLYIKENTYELYTVNHSGLLDLIVANCPGWKLGYVDDALIGKSFYFKETETDNAYDFLYTDIQEMAECIVEPNIITRIINVYSREYYADSHKTSIHLAKSNLLKHRVIEDDNEDKYTALVVKGDNDLDILFVNPIGDNVIYNFAPRLPWMSMQLQDAINRWTAKVNSVEKEYIELSKGYYEFQQEILIEEAKLNTLQSELNILLQDRDNIISNLQGYEIEEQQQALNSANNNITAKINAMAVLQTDLNNKKEEAKNNYKDFIDTINAECALALTAKDISGNDIFTSELLDELATHVKATEYTDEYMTVTDNMTYPERFSQAEKLMNRSKVQLAKISSGKKTYSVNTSSFLFNKRFAYFTEQLVPGAIVYVETENDIMEQLHLTAIDIDFKEKNTDFTLGNKYDRSDLQKLYEDTLGNNSKTSVAIKYITDIIENQKNRLDDYDNYIDSMLTLTVNHVLSSDDESFVINNRGIIGRVRQYEENNEPKIDANGNPLFDPEQIRMIHNGLYITDDNWRTVATAIGKIAIGENPDGTIKYDYGLIGKTIIGQLLIGNRLALYGGSVDGDGNYSITLDNNGLVIINDGNSAGITIKDANGNKQFYADSEGNLCIKGNITATSGTIGGCEIDVDGNLKITNANINGKLKVNQIEGTAATISDLNALSLSVGQIVADEISTAKFSASQITSGYLSASRIDVDSIYIDGTQITSGTINYNRVGGVKNNGTLGNSGWIAGSTYLYVDWYGKRSCLTESGISRGTASNMSDAVFASYANIIDCVNNSTSDETLKKDIEYFKTVEDYDVLFDNLNPVRYKYINGTSNRYHTGFIAQDVVEALSIANLTTQDFAAVCLEKNEDSTSRWYLRRDEFVALNTWQIQKAKARITELEEKVANLEARLLQ